MSPKSPEAVVIKTDDEKLVNPPGEPERGEERLENLRRLTNKQAQSLRTIREERDPAFFSYFAYGVRSTDTRSAEDNPMHERQYDIYYDICSKPSGEWAVFGCAEDSQQFERLKVIEVVDGGGGNFRVFVDRGSIVRPNGNNREEFRKEPYLTDMISIQTRPGVPAMAWSFCDRLDGSMEEMGPPAEVGSGLVLRPPREVVRRAVGDVALRHSDDIVLAAVA